MTQKSSGVAVPQSHEYLLPPPPRQAGEVVVVAKRRDIGATLRRGSEVAQRLGDRFLAQAEVHQILTAEVRERLTALDAAIPEASRAQLKGAVRDLLGVLEWCESVQADLVSEGRMAADGAEPVDVADLCALVGLDRETEEQPVLVTGQAPPWWGPAPLLAETIGLALDLVGERTQSMGARSIEISGAERQLQVAIRCAGEPSDGVTPGLVDRFRRCAAELRAKVRPDELGPGAASIVLELPSSAS